MSKIKKCRALSSTDTRLRDNAMVVRQRNRVKDGQAPPPRQGGPAKEGWFHVHQRIFVKDGQAFLPRQDVLVNEVWVYVRRCPHIDYL